MSKPLRFTKTTRLNVAGRCAYRCSFPGCDEPTIGPGTLSNQTALTGTQLTFSVRPQVAPRGQGDLTEEQLLSPENAIWMCSDHASYVDTNRGEKFPPALLLTYKALHEARIAKNKVGSIHQLAGFTS